VLRAGSTCCIRADDSDLVGRLRLERTIRTHAPVSAKLAEAWELDRVQAADGSAKLAVHSVLILGP